MEWPPAISSLEPLRPLTPDLFGQDDIADLGISVGRKLSRSEIAGKLLDHLDELNSEEPEPFDWFATEKSIDLPFFDNVPSPQQYYHQQQQKYQNNVSEFHNYAFQMSTPTINVVKNESRTSSPDYHQYEGISTSLGAPVTLAAAAAPSPQHHVMYTVAPGQLSPPIGTLSVSVPMTSPVSPVPSVGTGADWVKAETLTPPDSPKEDEFMKLLQEMEPNEMEQLAMARKLLQEIEPAELEQLVMTRVEDLTSNFEEKSCSMDEFSDGASSPYQGSDSGADDPEWSPPRRMKSVSGYSSAASCSSSATTATTSSRRKTKPYSRPAPEERKQRKKEQNKNAATRYRMKKKAEVEEVRNEEKQLLDKNKALKEELDDINREVKYLKSLMRDVYRKKGLIK